MEFGPSKSPESSSDDDTSEEKDSSSSSSSYKKSAHSSARVIELASGRPAKRAEASNSAPSFESLLRKIKGESHQELSILNLQSPEINSDSSKKFGEALLKRPETANADPALVPPVEQSAKDLEAHESSVSDESNPEMSDDANVVREAVQEFTEVRLREADSELHELPLEEQGSERAAEVAADIALLHAVRHNLTETSAMPPAEAIDAAERAVSEHVAALPRAESASSELDDTQSETDEAVGPAGAGGNGGGGDAEIPPSGPRPPEVPPPFGGYYSSETIAHAAAPTPVERVIDTSGDRRRAAAQGLLVGGIAGYFVGRRRGKKLGRREAERTAKPIRRSLERQVRSLQEAVTDKEQRIKSLARDRIQTVAKPVAREQLVRDILQPTREQVRTTPAVETLVAGAVVPIAADRLRSTQPERPVVQPSERTAEQATIIPSKKVEDFTRAELVASAEKIIVQGVSVRDMLELGTLSEQSVRRVVAEYLEGKDVAAAVSREVGKTERRYEQDPRLRQAQARQASAVGGGVLGILSPYSDTQAQTSEPQPANPRPVSSQQLPPVSSKGPVPDDATLQALRRRQAATVGLTAIIVAVVVTVLIIVTS